MQIKIYMASLIHKSGLIIMEYSPYAVVHSGLELKENILKVTNKT